MAINVSQAFHRTSANPVDDTLTLTKTEMLAVNDNLMPAKYFTVCQDDGKFYLYDKTNTSDPTTGKFRVFEGGGGGGSTLSGLTDTNISSPTDSQVLTYDAATSKWVNGAGGSGDYIARAFSIYGSTSLNEQYAEVGKTIVYYFIWPGGVITTNPGVPHPNGNADTYYLVSMTEDADGTYIDYVCNLFYTVSSTNYARQYMKKATKSGGTWTYGDWAEIGGADTDAYHSDDSTETTVTDADFVPFYDSSASATRKLQWTNIKSVLKTYFDSLYSTVKTRETPASGGTTLSVVNTGDMYNWNAKQNALTAGTNISMSNNIISATNTVALNYSTSEQVIGTWINGASLYQKTFTVSNVKFTAGSETNINHGISNFGLLVGCSLRLSTTESSYDNYLMSCAAYGRSSYVVVIPNSSWDAKSIRQWTITLQYTKTS